MKKEIAKDINDIFKRGDMTKTVYAFLRAKFISLYGFDIQKEKQEGKWIKKKNGGLIEKWKGLLEKI